MKKKEYVIRTDLAVQKKSLKLYDSYQKSDTKIKIYKKDNYEYTNIFFNDISLKENQNKLSKILKEELQKYLKKYHIKKDATILIVGLGNKNITSDSIGVKTAERIYATKHYEILNIINSGAKVSVLIPGVTNKTGILTFNVINSFKKLVKPDIIILIDSLVCSNIKYLNHLIQITDMGITPGSGLMNYQEEISKNSLNTPTIVIGIPTAIEISSIIATALGIKKSKMTYYSGYDMIVSSKDIDIFVDNISSIISYALNSFFNTI